MNECSLLRPTTSFTNNDSKESDNRVFTFPIVSLVPTAGRSTTAEPMVTTLPTIPQSASTNMPPSASTTPSTQSSTPSTQPGTDPRAISPDIQHSTAAATPDSTAQPTAQPAPRRTTRPPKSVQILNLHTALLPTPPEIIPKSVAELLKTLGVKP